MKILVIEDDTKLAGLLERGLTSAGHVVDAEHDGASGRKAALCGTYDILVLDLMLPKVDGLTVLRDLRAKGVNAPVIVLTARDETADVVAGFDAGADDYLRKPFAFDELYARVRTLGRRTASAPRLVLRTGDLTLDTATQRVERAGRPISLTTRELAYLEYFMRNEGLVITRGMLENALWNRDAEPSSNVVDVYVKRLRAKIEGDGLPPLFSTIRGVGYRFG
jgi:DNA-binding response OmpR family regulator